MPVLGRLAGNIPLDAGKARGLYLCMVLGTGIAFRNIHCYVMYFVIRKHNQSY